MGQVGSFLSRKVNRFNVENRAHRVLERDKPTMAPRYPHSLKDMERTLEVDPKFLDKLNVKDQSLDERLKNVYVTSEDRVHSLPLKNNETESSKLLPTNRSIQEEYEYGFQEPEYVPEGHCTLRQAMKFVYDHQIEPKYWTAERIASEYKMNSELVGKILYYYKGYKLYVPDKNAKESVLIQAKPDLLVEQPKQKSSDSGTRE